MSIIDSYDESDEFINPSLIIEKNLEMASITIVVFEKHNLDAFLFRYQYEKITSINIGLEVPIYRINCDGTFINVFLSIQNSSAAAECLELMIAMGCRKFVYYGSCGALDNSITSKHVIIPTEAYRDEGMSYHYAPACDFIHIKNADLVIKYMDMLNIAYLRVKTWTTDAIFRETKNIIQKRKEQGCKVVELECSSIEAVANFRKAEVYYFLYAEDSLGGPEWNPGTMGKMTSTISEIYSDIALHIAKNLEVL